MATDTATLEISELEKYIILLVYVDDEPIHGRQKLQLLMYMLGDPYPEIREWCDFVIQDDGPYSTVLDTTLGRLVQMKLLVEKDDTVQLTNQHVECAKVIASEKNKILEFPGLFNTTMADVFDNYKSIINDVTIPEALSFLYCLYPDMTKDSATYKKLKPDIKEHVISMYVKKKITLGRTGELLGIPKHIMMNEMAKRKLLWI